TCADTALQVVRKEYASQFMKESAPARGRCLRWFQPVVSVPAFAALLLIIAYQNTVTIPQARNTSSRAVPEVYGQSFLLRPSDTRGGNEKGVNGAAVEVQPNEGFRSEERR